jgi:hypothetical protein
MSKSAPKSARTMPNEIRMSGALVERHRHALEALLTPQRVERALSRLSGEQRDEFVQASTLSWVRIPTLESAFRELAREASRDPSELQVEVVKRSVEANVRGIWRIFLRLTTIDSLVSRLPRIYGRAFDGGEVVIDSIEAGGAQFHVAGWPDMPAYARRGLAAGTEAALAVAGLQNVRVSATPTAASSSGGLARFSARWRV